MRLQAVYIARATVCVPLVIWSFGMRMAFLLCLSALAAVAQPKQSYRVLVTTDLGGDPDDIQSLYRLIHYSDILKVEGIVSSPGPGARNAASKIAEWIKRVDVDQLRAGGHKGLMPEAQLLGMVRQGALKAGPPGPGKSTDGSRLIVERARERDPRPLWVQAWGSMTDIAQALHDDPGIAQKIRIFSIGSANTRRDPKARDYVFSGIVSGKWRTLWWIESGTLPLQQYDTFRGVYQGGDQSGEWNNVEFVNRNIRGHGSTHDGLFKEPCGDAFPLAGGILKEGDSPAMLFLLSPVIGGVGDVDDPTRENWGGRYRHFDRAKYPNFSVDLDRTAEECRATVSKWRKAFLADWKARWDWYGTGQ